MRGYFLSSLSVPAAVAVMCLLPSCCRKVYPPTVRTDSVRVEVRERIVHDTVTFDVPQIIERNVTLDTVSRLDVGWAQSEAIVSGGVLSHTLETKPRTVPVPVTVTARDTIVMERQAEVRTVEVERELTGWQSFWIRSGQIAALALLVLMTIFVVRILRTPLRA